MQTTKAELAARARIALDTWKWCENNCPDDAEKLDAAHTEFQKHAQAYSAFIDKELKMKTIEELKARLQGYLQDKAHGVISVAEYQAHEARINSQIERLKNPTNCTYSQDPEPGHYAHPGKKARLKALNDYNAKLSELRKNGIKDNAGHRNFGRERELRSILTGACNQLSHTDSLEVIQAIVSETARLIAELPDLNPISKAA